MQKSAAYLRNAALMGVGSVLVLAMWGFLPSPPRQSIFQRQAQAPAVTGSTPTAKFIDAVGNIESQLNRSMIFLGATAVIFAGLAFYRWQQPNAWVEALLAGASLGQILHLLLSS
jgi:hypothetical protein